MNTRSAFSYEYAISHYGARKGWQGSIGSGMKMETYFCKCGRISENKLCDRCSPKKSGYVANKFKYHLQRLRRKCEKLGLPFDLDLDYFESLKVERCPVLGLQLDYEATGRPGPNCFSLDRIVPERGYVKDNVHIISYKANAMKHNASIDELLDFANWVKRTFEGQSDRFG